MSTDSPRASARSINASTAGTNLSKILAISSGLDSGHPKSRYRIPRFENFDGNSFAQQLTMCVIVLFWRNS